MIEFKQYIAELFDRKIPVNLSSTGDTSWGYTFILMYKNGKPQLAPRGKDLEKFVEDHFAKQGIERQSITPVQLNQAFKGVAYIVEFYNIKYEKEYAELELISDGDIRNGVWELSFTMREATVEFQTSGRPSVSGRYYWKWDTGTDDDVNRFSAADAAMILGAVTDAAVDFVKQKKPRGIILGTKTTANPARGRIYKMLARAAAKKTGGTFHETETSRDRMANGVIVWFDKEEPFKLYGSDYDKP